MKRHLLPFGLTLLLLSGCGERNAGPHGLPDDNRPPATSVETDAATAEAPSYLGQTAPDFTLKTLDGQTFRLSDHRGKVVLINFWATWCGPCVIETPELVALYNDLKGRGLMIVGVSLDEEGFEVVRPFAEEFDVTYPLVVDDGAVAEAYGGIYGLPTTFVLDREGKIRHRFIGLFPTGEMRPEIEKMLARDAG
ncbi:TlpA family protein disulfide reductase [Rhodocaloribacter litoris]|uniref:peroxiredoxin family protein n=1 Tax=Rhodocaloribacter litoris TaxID=2558931 RepID=UPI00141E1E9B|nr:TlpA disulfide reductase family protein [Rhodocaloribacter litoris]QXD15582.1 TlpA family protein disulfide reductase [Rhodocaloribacter litoris]GIV60916.1 MAG: hypothetical protein KatS3mg043_2005 [Rhodothermaceae bacterium]